MAGQTRLCFESAGGGLCHVPSQKQVSCQKVKAFTRTFLTRREKRIGDERKGHQVPPADHSTMPSHCQRRWTASADVSGGFTERTDGRNQALSAQETVQYDEGRVALAVPSTRLESFRGGKRAGRWQKERVVGNWPLLKGRSAAVAPRSLSFLPCGGACLTSKGHSRT
jgi:hypothetical protein